MSLLDDAQEIARNGLQTLTVTGTMVCVFCGRNPCRSSCVRHSLPRIVAALEATERLTASDGHLTQNLPCDPWACVYCDYMSGHGDDCPLGAVVEAMQGT